MLKNDKREIFRAAADASRIAEWILSTIRRMASADDERDPADDEQPSPASDRGLSGLTLRPA